MPFYWLLLLIIWAYTVVLLLQGKKVIISCSLPYKYVTALVFFIFGLSFYLLNRNIRSLLLFISLTFSAIAYEIVPLGLTTKGFFITGKFYPYSKAKEISLYDRKGRLVIEFTYHYHVYFLYPESSDVQGIRQFLKKNKVIFRG